MYGTMNIINPDAFIKEMKAIECGEKYAAYLEAKDFELKQFETTPLAGFEVPKNFPNCCNSHISIFKIGVDKFNAFPNCCTAHQKLITAHWFKKENYAYMPLKLATTFAYTWHCITKCINNPNWYKEITNYIDITKHSYGQFPDGYGVSIGLDLYLHNIQKNIEQETEIPDFKKSQLIDFIKSYQKSVKNVEQIDVNLLIDTYKKWLKDFPFELSFFAHLKPYFETQLPIIEGIGETNLYSELVSFKIKTPKALISFLVSLTESILNETNTLTLYEKGLINDVQKTYIELINANRRLKLHETREKPTNEKQQYIKVLKGWLKDEKEYLRELTTALAITISQPKEATVENKTVSIIKNNFDNVLINDVFKHFKNGLVDKKYVSEKELTDFLVFAFEKKEIPNPLFRFSNVQTKQKIIRVFYEYYKDVASKPHRRQRQYAALLCNYFEGFYIENVSTNFNK